MENHYCFMGKPTNSMAMFNSYVSHYQKVNSTWTSSRCMCKFPSENIPYICLNRYIPSTVDICVLWDTNQSNPRPRFAAAAFNCSTSFSFVAAWHVSMIDSQAFGYGWMQQHNDWFVVSTPLKNISLLGWLFPIYGKTKTVPNHQPVLDRWTGK